MEVLKKYQLGILGVNSKNLVYQSFNLDNELSKVNPVKALTSGKITANDIGKTVYLSNSVSNCQEWIIIGINHDSTSGTVDLISKSSMLLWNTDTSKTATASEYGNSNTNGLMVNMNENATYSVRKFLENEVVPGFTNDIKNVLKTMNVDWVVKGNTSYNSWNAGVTASYQTKIKVPSCYELGFRTNGGLYFNGLYDNYNANGIGINLGEEYSYFPGFDTQNAMPANLQNLLDRNTIGISDKQWTVWYITRENKLDARTYESGGCVGYTSPIIIYKRLDNTKWRTSNIRANLFIENAKKKAYDYGLGYTNRVSLLFGAIIRF